MAGRVELSVVAKNQASKVLKQVGGDIRGLSKEAGNAKSAFSDMFSIAGGNLLARGIQSATSAVVGLGKAFIGTIADAASASASMNAQVSGIGAVLGLTAGELVKVKDLINQLGVDPNLKVNAQEAADAIDMLARNGLTLQQILDGAAEATVFLANATGGSFEASANVATDAMAMFKVEAKDMMSVVNGVTSVTTASKFGLDDYSLAMAQGGGVAAALGVELTDFNTTLVATASAFSGGSDAGTSFKTFLQRLVPQSNEAAEAMADLGLYNFNTQVAMSTLANMGVKPLSSDMDGLLTQLLGAYAATNNVNVTTEEGIAKFNAWAQEVGFVQSAFYDANGSLKSMADISSVLAEATSGLTELQKNQYLTQIFQSDAMRTAFGLAESGVVVYTDLSVASRELGVSQEDLAQYMEGGITAFEALQATMGQTDALASAQMRVNNLAGDMEIFSGIVDSVRIQIGDKFDPVLRNVFQGLTTTFTQLTPQFLAFGDVIANTVAAGVERLSNAFRAFQSGGGVADIGKALGISPRVTGAITWVIKNINLLKGAIKGIGVAIAAGGAFAALGTALAALINPFTLLIGAAAALGAAWETNFGGIREKTQFAQDAIYDFLAAVQNAQSMASLTFSVTGEVSSSLMTGLAELTGGKTTIDTEAKVVSIDWGDTGYTYDATSQITSVDWVGGLVGGIGDFTYDAKSKVLSVDWVSSLGDGGMGFTYDADAGITSVNWNSEEFKYAYDASANVTSVDFAQGLYQGKYTASADITSILWGVYYGHYEADAGVTDVVWGVYTHTYQPDAEVTKVLWGLYRTTYEADAKISTVSWLGGSFTHTYDAIAKIGQVEWLGGAYTHTYDARAQVGEKSVLWGLWSWTYDAKAGVTEVTFAGGVLEKAGATLSGLFVNLGGSLAEAADSIGQSLNAPPWVQDLINWKPSEGAPAWIKDLTVKLAPGIITTLSNIVLKPPSVGDLPLLTMSIPTLSSDFWPSLPSFSWPDLPEWGWPTLPSFTWPDLPVFTWPALPDFTWPDIPMPGWVTYLGGLIEQAKSLNPLNLFDNNATGTNFFEGGWTWVGERGPELLNLPRGSKILSNTESKKMIGQLADGTTTAAAVTPSQGGGGNVFAAISAAAANMGRAGDSMRKAGQTISDSIKDLEANLRKVPGLFGASQVTDQQMKMAELGIPQNFADDWLRRLTDEVVNGVNWEGVDIKDAALRAGLDPALPAEAILELVTQKWNDKSLFANAANLDLINQDAVKAALEAQAQQAAGEQNLLALFGVTPEQARTAGAATGTAAGGGVLTGITQSLTSNGAGQQVASSIATGVTPESMAPVGGSVVTALTAELGKEEYSTTAGAALAGLFTGYLEKADAFVDVAQRIMGKIAAQFSNVGALDMVDRFVTSFRAQLGSEEAIASLTAVGEKILELVFRGYLDEALRRNWAEGVNAKGDTSNKGTGSAGTGGSTNTAPTTNARNAIGTSSWRGGWTMVGETGPELVALPPRSRIFNPMETLAMAGAGGGDTININVNATVANDIDVQQLAYRISDILRKRR